MFDSEFDAMVATLLITGTRADAVIERIGVEGSAGNFAGSNLINGRYIEGVMPNPGGPWSIDSSPPLQGTFVVRDSSFTNAAFNLATTNLVDSLVLIEGNTFDASPGVDGGACDIDLLDSSTTVTIVRNNRLNGVRGTEIHFVRGEFLTDLEPSLLLVSGNQIRAQSVGQGIVLSGTIYGSGGGPTLEAIITGNPSNSRASRMQSLQLHPQAYGCSATGSEEPVGQGSLWEPLSAPRKSRTRRDGPLPETISPTSTFGDRASCSDKAPTAPRSYVGRGRRDQRHRRMRSLSATRLREWIRVLRGGIRPLATSRSQDVPSTSGTIRSIQARSDA